MVQLGRKRPMILITGATGTLGSEVVKRLSLWLIDNCPFAGHPNPTSTSAFPTAPPSSTVIGD
jgi:nucleoside-diphosphate-sugar epimerase